MLLHARLVSFNRIVANYKNYMAYFLLTPKNEAPTNPNFQSLQPWLAANQMAAHGFCQKIGMYNGCKPNKNNLPIFWSCQIFGGADWGANQTHPYPLQDIIKNIIDMVIARETEPQLKVI